MSKQENNLTKAEKSVLKGLNIRANLILQVEEIFMDAKIPIDKNLLYDMTEEDLLGLIETWAPEVQEAKRAKHMKKNDD
jgi:hypothetical protein